MRKLIDLKLHMSICPEEYNGIPIPETRRIQMGNCLYQILQNPEIIPLEFQWARNIVDRYVEINDGYKVLYSMVEPILTTDTVLSHPNSADCNTIHEYSKRLTSYIKCEAIAGQYYSEKEQVNLFLDGLDPIWENCVTRAKSLMENTKINDKSVPEILQLEKIPDTMERFYRQETGKKPTIRAMTGNAKLADKRGTQNARGSFNKTTNAKQVNLVDKPCNICHAWSHLKSHCGGFARFLLFQDAASKCDDVFKTKVINNYKTDMKTKGEAKLRNQKLGTVRQMWEQGCSYEEVEQNLMAMMTEETNYTASTYSDEEDVE
jgi:hypothetical protein